MSARLPTPCPDPPWFTSRERAAKRAVLDALAGSGHDHMRLDAAASARVTLAALLRVVAELGVDPEDAFDLIQRTLHGLVAQRPALN